MALPTAPRNCAAPLSLSGRTMPPSHEPYDAVLVGGGLQNALIALALFELQPGCRLALVEREPHVGGQHTWCFHAADLPAAARSFVAPLVEHEWPGYDVCFPGWTRTLTSPYAGFSAGRLREVLSARFAAAPGSLLRTAAQAVQITPHEVLLGDGSRLRGELVVDARGPAARAQHAGYQVFVGREFELEAPHGLARPIVMDATVPQKGGYRFFYCLPLGPRRLLVEDTRFADRPELHRDAFRHEIARYCESRGFVVSALIREEEGILPMPWRMPMPAPRRSPLHAGYAGGFVHPATGYSFPIAVRLATCIGHTGTKALFGHALARLVRRHRTQLRFACLLNRLLFRWFLPEHRRPVFERFYRLPEARIRRFYALETRLSDRLRLLSGRPPRGFSLRARLRAPESPHEPARL